MGSGVVLVCVVVSACAALDYSLGPVIPESQYGDEDALQKQSDQDTMEYMDNLKEELDTSITPLSEMNSDVSVDITKRPSKPRARIGRPRKTTLFPVIKEVYNGTKRRMRWDNNVNKFIMFNYYYVTRMETDKNQYRRKLREKFLEAYPNFQGVTDQRVADQKRSIKQNRLLDIQTLREIKRAARQQLEKEGIVVENEEDSKDSSFYD